MIKKEYYVDAEVAFQTKLYLGWTYLTTKEFFKKNKTTTHMLLSREDLNSFNDIIFN